MLSPRFTLAGPVLTIARSSSVTLVVTVDVSSVGVPSVGTLAVLVTVPVWVVFTSKEIGPTDWPGVRVPTLQVTTLVLVSKVRGAPALTNVVVAGRVSVQVALG